VTPSVVSWPSTSTSSAAGRTEASTTSTGWWAKSGTPHSSVSMRWVPISVRVEKRLRALTAATFGRSSNCASCALDSATSSIGTATS